MPQVVACIDGSAYDSGVCDHALWLAGPLEAEVEILRTDLDADAFETSHPDQRALGRLLDQGAQHVRILRRDGALADQVAASGADIVVMGKRRDGQTGSAALGPAVGPLAVDWQGPLCLAAKIFMPIYRCLVLMDDDPGHHDALDFVLAHPRFADMHLEVAVLCGEKEPGRRKAAAIRERLRGRDAEVIESSDSGLTDALLHHMESRSADIFVISRPVLFPDAESRLRRVESCGLCAWRTPVLIC